MHVFIRMTAAVLTLLVWLSPAQSGVQVPESVLVVTGGTLIDDDKNKANSLIAAAIVRAFSRQVESEFKEMGIASHVHIEADRTAEYRDFLPPLFGLKHWNGVLMIGTYVESTLNDRTFYAQLEYSWVQYEKENRITFSKPYKKKYPIHSETQKDYRNTDLGEVAHLFMRDLRADVFKLPACWKGLCDER